METSTLILQSGKVNDHEYNTTFLLNQEIQRLKSPVSDSSVMNNNTNNNNNNANNNNSSISSSDDTTTIFSDAISLNTDERCGSTNTILSEEDTTIKSKTCELMDTNLTSNVDKGMIISHSHWTAPSYNLSAEDIKKNEFLNHIDPMPRKPPSYNKMNPNKSIRYPIFENNMACQKDDTPPSYAPTVEKFTIVSIKSEYLSPYEPSTSKTWKNFIMEINSTQLNFYSIDSSLTHRIKNYSGGYDHNHGNSLYHLDSSNTSKFFSFNHKTTYNFTKYDQEHICYNIQRYKKKFITQERLYKSFSLQFAKFGIPIDYNKKTFVLRIRCESEQFLINFAHVDDMINWTTYLSMGISVSLDLELRDMPDYRIVPRRRRRRRRIHSHNRRHGFVSNSNNNNNNNKHPSCTTTITTTRRTRDIMTSHLPDSAFNGLSESSSRRSSVPNSRKNSNVSSTSQTLDQSFSTLSLESSMRSTNRAPSRRGSSVNLQDSPYKFISQNSNFSTSPSSSTSSSSTNLKSKLKGLFKIGYTPKKSIISQLPQQITTTTTTTNPISIPSSPTSTQANALCFISTSVSPTSSAPSSPVMRSSSFKNYSTATSLNSLIEDEDENAEDVSLPGGMQFSRTHNSRLRSVSSPLYHAAHIKIPSQSNDYSNICPKDTSRSPKYTSHTYDYRNKLVQRNSIILQHELDELHEVLREHQESDADEDDDDDEDDEDDEDEISQPVVSNQPYTRMDSVYSDEGIFHDSDAEEQEYYPNYTQRASSLMSSLSYGVSNDEVKWHPSINDVSRRRQIRNSLRCIRPFLEDNEWVGYVCFKAANCPPYETNNKPISYNGRKGSIKSRKNSTGTHRAHDYINMKNHYLESFVVGPVDFIKADTPTVRRISGIKNKKNKDDDVESRLLLAYGS